MAKEECGHFAGTPRQTERALRAGTAGNWWAATERCSPTSETASLAERTSAGTLLALVGKQNCGDLRRGPELRSISCFIIVGCRLGRNGLGHEHCGPRVLPPSFWHGPGELGGPQFRIVQGGGAVRCSHVLCDGRFMQRGRVVGASPCSWSWAIVGLAKHPTH